MNPNATAPVAGIQTSRLDMSPAGRSDLSPLSLWICFCVLLNVAGWMLSALHALNQKGYAVVFALGAVACFCWRKELGFGIVRRCNPTRLRRRFTRLFPAGFLVMAVLALLGGVLHAPNNYDALAYRVPRVLHWLATEQWHWIHTDFPRLNVRACGIEWVSAPLIAFTKSDRLLFLINVVSFLFLPGIFFSLLTRLGVRRRVAWNWMWLLPTGYCYLLQAGSIGNDLFGAVFAMAAVGFALRARAARAPRDFWMSVLAAALVTSGKMSNLPLLLPWAVAVAPSLRIARRRPLATAAVCVVAVVASLAPVAWMNWKHTGDWTGLAAESLQLSKGEPAIRIANNAVLLTIQNFAPPIFPMANAWNRAAPRLMPRAFAEKVESDFDPEGAHWLLGEMQMEEGAGLGFGVGWLLLASTVAALRRATTPSRCKPSPANDKFFRIALLTSVWLALLVFMLKSNTGSGARLATPYYGLMVVVCLLPHGHTRVVSARWWRCCAAAVFILAGLLLVVSPARPLWPARTILTHLGAEAATGGLLTRARTVYSVYGARADGFKPIRDRLPAEARLLGFVSTDDPETSLWRTFGSRRVLHVSPADSAADLRQRGIQYVLVSAESWSRLAKQTLESWLAANDAVMVEKFSLKLRASKEYSDWYLIKLSPAASKNSSTSPPVP